MQQRYSALVIVFLFCGLTGTSAADEPLLTLSKKKALARKTEIAGQAETSPAYDYGVIVLRNRLREPVTLSWNIEEDQNFVPVVRSAAGRVVSNGHPFGFARSPRAKLEERTVPPGKDHTIEAHMLFETVPEEHKKAGTYSIRVQFLIGKSLWESNEIRVVLRE